MTWLYTNEHKHKRWHELFMKLKVIYYLHDGIRNDGYYRDGYLFECRICGQKKEVFYISEECAIVSS